MRIGNPRRFPRRLWVVAALVLGAVAPARAEPAEKKAAPARKSAAARPVAPSAPPEALLTSEAWRDVPTTPLQPGEIDRLLEAEFLTAGVVPAPPIGDEQFLRRARLDLTGQLPTAAEIEEFLADPGPEKRARWVDRWLDSDQYAHHWARYWCGAITAVEAPFGNAHVPKFENWLYEQIRRDRPWDAIARDLITAEGILKKKDDTGINPAVFFLGRHNGPDGNIVRAAETVRLFLGIQIQCAQCHDDRRTGFWKQVQFHEMTGFFARMTVGGSSGELIKLGAKNNGEHEMPDRKDPKLAYVTYPKFLDGQAPGAGLGDRERRQALADYLTGWDNYWFSAAYVNRIWNELLGQSFYERVDDLGPKGAVVFPAVVRRLAAAFRGGGYATKGLIRAIVNSRAYQRQARLGAAPDEHLRFVAVYPTRLRAEVLWDALAAILGPLPTTGPQGPDGFKSEFQFDPSLRPDEVTGGITQALWLLNSPLVNDRVKFQDYRTPPAPGPKGKGASASPPQPTLLKRLLAENEDDDPAIIRAVYLHVLARRPTDRELATCLQYLEEGRQGEVSRNEGFEDILKALINTTEFQKKR